MDAVVVGSGPNGLAAAVLLAEAGLQVQVLEARHTPGGGARTAETTLPGFRHDICSAVHPLGIGSPFFRTLPLRDYGLNWVHPGVPLAHPLDDGTVAILDRSPQVTAAGLGCDGEAYLELLRPLIPDWDLLCRVLLDPSLLLFHLFGGLRFGWQALKPASNLAARFRGKGARGLWGGLAAHSFLPLEQPGSCGYALALAITAHSVGWPFPRSGAQALTDALVCLLTRLGGQLMTRVEVQSMDDLPATRAVLFDVGPHQLARIAQKRLPPGYRSALRQYRYGPGVFKMDWALAGPVPWTAPDCHRAGTLHLGATFEEIAESERAVWRGEHAARPFVIVSQPSLFDGSRAPGGKHTLWGYCHVPARSDFDMSERIEQQIERFAPGFRELILERHTMASAALEDHNPNNVGGDINGGLGDVRQILARPVLSAKPYRTPVSGIYLCSASTPPGGGVHGMCGYWAARTALTDMAKGRALTPGP